MSVIIGFVLVGTSIIFGCSCLFGLEIGMEWGVRFFLAVELWFLLIVLGSYLIGGK